MSDKCGLEMGDIGGHQSRFDNESDVFGRGESTTAVRGDCCGFDIKKQT